MYLTKFVPFDVIEIGVIFACFNILSSASEALDILFLFEHFFFITKLGINGSSCVDNTFL
jgi:hypothetical protein